MGRVDDLSLIASGIGRRHSHLPRDLVKAAVIAPWLAVGKYTMQSKSITPDATDNSRDAFTNHLSAAHGVGGDAFTIVELTSQLLNNSRPAFSFSD